jgi:hypothetical protein
VNCQWRWDLREQIDVLQMMDDDFAVFGPLD